MRRLMSWIAAAGLLTGGLVLGTQVSTESRVEAAVNGGWSALADGLNGRVFVTYQADDTNPISGTNPLYVGGEFTDAGGDTAADYLAKWDGSAWSKVATTAFTARGGLTYVASIAKSGNDLYVGGVFAAGASINIAKIDISTGASYGTVSALGTGMSGGRYDSVVEEIAVIGSNVYAGGAFGAAGGVANTAGVAVWNGTAWGALAGGLSGTTKDVNGIAAVSTTLYVGGQFDGAASPAVTSKGVMSWNGTAWTAMSATQKGFTGSPLTAALLARSTTEVYAAGARISSTNDDTSADRITLNGIAKWSDVDPGAGVTLGWSALGTGISGGGAVVETLAWSGTTLWAGGDFTTAGGVTANNIAKWDGTSWDSITCGARNGVSGGAVRGIAPQSDGSVIVAGAFTNAGGNRFIAKFTPGADNCPSESSGSDDPVFIDFDGNGGICTPSALRADRVSAAEAFAAVKCSFGNRTLRGFSQSATSSGFFTARDPIYFTGGNRYFAVWGVPNPQEVVATPGLNSVTVSWKPPVADTGLPVFGYSVAVKAATESRYNGACRVTAEVNQCRIDLPATNLTYTFMVTAIDQRGFGSDSVESSAVSPYSLTNIVTSRADVLFGLGGTNVKATGLALGLAGKAVNAEYKVGSAKNWTTVTNAATVNAEGKFSWSKKFAASLNKQNVALRFTYGTDAATGTFVLARGSENGDLTAPRNIKVVNEVRQLIVTWDPPKFNGGEKITGYTMCAVRAGSLCRNVSAEGSATFRDLMGGQPYTITVAAVTATRTGPSASAKQQVVPTEASVIITSRRESFEIKVQADGIGFAANAKFRLELAAAVPGVPTKSWRWETINEFTANQRFSRGFNVDLGQAYEGETLAVRLVTPTGIVYSRLSRP